jgi:hypothetical protein
MSLETWEFLSYVVTVVGLPLAIVAYMFEQRKERRGEEGDVSAPLRQLPGVPEGRARELRPAATSLAAAVDLSDERATAGSSCSRC